LRWWPTVAPDSYYTFASGGLGWNAPAAVGIALAQRKSGEDRPVIAMIGDGSLQYSVQSLYSAAQHRLKIVYVVPCNDEYAILKQFAELEKTPNVPALDLPGLDVVTTALGFGCAAVRAKTREEIQQAFKVALAADGPTLIAIPIMRELLPLVPDVPD
jgi:benzoylformate decarboxylase